MRPRIKQLQDSLHLIASTDPDQPDIGLSEIVSKAISKGATGVQTSVWTTSDGVLVANGTGQHRRRIRKVPISKIRFDQLAASSCSFDELIQAVGLGSIHLLVSDESSLQTAIDVTRDVQAEDQLWLISDDLTLLTRWRTRTSAKLINSVRLRDLKQGPERFAADLKDRTIDGLEMFHSDWNGGLLTMFHRFGLLGVAVDAEQQREMANLIDAGMDVLRTSRINRLVETGSQFTIGES